MSPIVTAIILNFNGFEDTIECLHSLHAQEGVSCRPLVIDNASMDDSMAHIRAAHPSVEVVAAETNLGFCGGNNLGIADALRGDGDYLYLVNNDTAMEPDCLAKLLACAQAHPEAAVVSPAIYDYHDHTRPWFQGSAIDGKAGTFSHTAISMLPGEAAQIPWTTGCAMLIPQPVMRQIGGFDERFFCYYEDVDWSLRARRAGYTCLLCPDATLYHKIASSFGGSATPRREYYNARNHLLCLSKNVSGPDRRRLLTFRTQRALHQAKRWLKSGSPASQKRQGRAVLIGTRDFYARRFGKRQYRWME